MQGDGGRGRAGSAGPPENRDMGLNLDKKPDETSMKLS